MFVVYVRIFVAGKHVALRYIFHSMGAPYVLLLVLRNSDVEWCIAVEVMKQECFCKVHLKNTMNVADVKR